MPVLLFFIDGLGIGRREKSNPLNNLPDSEPLAIFQDEEPEIIYDGVLVRTDVCLGVEGRPQSASGQTTILTGINIPQKLGYHKQGFPNTEMREILADYSIFLQLEELGIEPNLFVNAYTPSFFNETPRWKSATTCAVETATMRFRTIQDLIENKALFHDFTNRVLIKNGYTEQDGALFKVREYYQSKGFNFDLKPRTAEEAGKILAELTSNYRFTLYEYFITDKIGHEQDFETARRIVPQLAKVVRTVLENLDLTQTTVILTSDHGNIEDLSIRNHTLNDVPTIIWGHNRTEIAKQISSLSDLTPAIVNRLKSESYQQTLTNN
jgi:hypothetical protein